jgi:glycosyltransferase involved in cell wall biosynthesis
MKNEKPFGLFVLGGPILVDAEDIRFRDALFSRTLNITREYVPRSLIVARTRKYNASHGDCPSLRDVGAELVLTVPDYAAGGVRGLYNLALLFNPVLQQKIQSCVESAEFIYVEGLSLSAFLTAIAARRAGRKLIMELRGSVLLNPDYMQQRFGFVGQILRLLHERQFVFIRSQSCAASYVNESLLKAYPIAGNIQSVLLNVHLPDGFGGSPRVYTNSAKRYLYVGHLETVKRVDLILQALHLAHEQLPTGWHFDIVGSGPMEGHLRTLVEQFGLEKHVTFHGRVAWGEPLSKLYEQADMLLVASTSESGPRVAIEAMAFGLPVISTRVGLPLELLEQDALVPIGDCKAYAQKMIDLVNNPTRLTEFGKSNWQLAQQFRQPILEAKRREFWEQAIEASRHSVCDTSGFNRS